MLGIPQSGQTEVEVLQDEWSEATGNYNLCPSVTPILDMEQIGLPKVTDYRIQQDTSVYNRDGFFPQTQIEIAPKGIIRGQRVAVLRIQPFQYNPAHRTLKYATRIRFRVNYPESDLKIHPLSGSATENEGLFEDVLSDVLINYETARAWRANQLVAPKLNLSGTYLDQPFHKILVAENGIISVTYNDLKSAGVPVDSLNPRTFRLINHGQEIALLVMCKEENVFQAGDYFLFIGLNPTTKWTNTDVYWLTWDAGDGQRILPQQAAPENGYSVPKTFTETTHLETNSYYMPNNPSGPDRDRWYWDFFSATTKPVRRGYSFTLEQVSSEPVSATVQGLLGSYHALPLHHTRIYLNKHLIDDAFWPNKGELSFETNIPQTFLTSSTNVITVELPHETGIITTDVQLLNRFVIDYARWYTATHNQLDFTGQPGEWEFQVGGFTTNTIQVFDVTTPTQPVQITGAVLDGTNGKYRLRFEQRLDREHRYLAMPPARWLKPQGILKDDPSDLHNLANAADYIIISHGDFITDIQPLADWRASQGWRVKVVDVQDVYDEFSYGLLDPHAIHDFLVYTYENWQRPAPAYVLLVGDGNFDYKNYMGNNERIFIPPYLADVDQFMGETAANNYYVSVSGDDPLPDMHLGILPVRTRSSTASVVSKILAYDQNPPQDSWNQTAMFVADKYDPEAGDFPYLSDEIVNGHFPAPYIAEKVYYGITHTTASSVRNAVINGINQGRLVVSYVGHGSMMQWGADKLFAVDQIPQLNNAVALPFVASMTCQDGYYIYPSPPGIDYSSLAESMLLATSKGAIASFSPTGLGLATGHDRMESGLFDAIFHDYVTDLGTATTLAKLYMYSSTGGSYEDLVETYLLFGDPATQLPVLRPDLKISKIGASSGLIYPGYQITYQIGFTNTGQGLATHIVLSDTLPMNLEDVHVTSSGITLIAQPGSRFIWDAVDMAQGQSGQITITARVPIDYHGWLNNSHHHRQPGKCVPLGRPARYLADGSVLPVIAANNQ